MSNLEIMCMTFLVPEANNSISVYSDTSVRFLALFTFTEYCFTFQYYSGTSLK